MPAQPVLSTKGLPSPHQNEGIAGYPILRYQQGAFGWGKQLARYPDSAALS